MPYADREKQRAYNRSWASRKRDTAAHSPMADDVMYVLRLYIKPQGPAVILAHLQELRPSATASSLNVCLNRMKHGGRIAHVGYGQWQVAE